MLRRYKLRLGDGTLLVVDRDGLGTWQMDRKAMVQAVGGYDWQPLREFLARERAAARRASRQEQPKPSVPLPLVYPKPRETEAAPAPPAQDIGPTAEEEPAIVTFTPPLENEPPELSARAPEGELPPPFFTEEAPPEPVLADEPAVPPGGDEPGETTADEEPESIPFATWVEDETPESPVAPPTSEPLPAVLAEEPPSLQVVAEEPTVPRLQVLADDPGPSRASRKPADDGVAVLKLKPLDDEAPARPAGARPELAARDDIDIEAAPRRPPFEDLLLQLISACQALLAQSRAGLRAYKPVLMSELQVLRDRASRWLDGYMRSVEGAIRSVDRLVHRVRSSPAALSAGPVAPRAVEPRPREPAPLPVAELPVLRLKELHEPEPEEEVYEGEGFVTVAARWAKRAVVVAGLTGGVVVAALTWESWVPEAADLGRTVAGEIDRYARSREETQRLERALQEVAPELPHLAPETVRLVLSSRPAGDPDPPEVFRLSYEAADRGRSALTPAEAKELKALELELLGTLSPTEREQVREYARVRGHRGTFPFEDRRVLELFADGARALSEASRERLRALSGKTVAAGLALPAAAASPTAPLKAPSGRRDRGGGSAR